MFGWERLKVCNVSFFLITILPFVITFNQETHAHLLSLNFGMKGTDLDETCWFIAKIIKLLKKKSNNDNRMKVHLCW